MVNAKIPEKREKTQNKKGQPLSLAPKLMPRSKRAC